MLESSSNKLIVGTTVVQSSTTMGNDTSKPATLDKKKELRMVLIGPPGKSIRVNYQGLGRELKHPGSRKNFVSVI